MRGLHELDPVAQLVEPAKDPVDPVARIAVDLPHAVAVEPVEDVRPDGLCHPIALPVAPDRYAP